jgi:hypothetical protein
MVQSGSVRNWSEQLRIPINPGIKANSARNTPFLRLVPYLIFDWGEVSLVRTCQKNPGPTALSSIGVTDVKRPTTKALLIGIASTGSYQYSVLPLTYDNTPVDSAIAPMPEYSR